MFRFHKIGFMCIIITCLSLAFAETIKKHTSTADSSTSSKTGYSSNFSKERQNDVEMEYVKEFNVSQSWKSMESTVINILTAMYNKTMPFMSQVNKDLDISSTCKRDLMKMLTGIKEFKYWAVQMFDSFGKIPIGIGSGTISSLGDFDQCLEVVVPGHFEGQYCNLDLILPMPKREPFVPSDTEVPELMNVLKPDGVQNGDNISELFYNFLVDKIWTFIHHSVIIRYFLTILGFISSIIHCRVSLDNSDIIHIFFKVFGKYGRFTYFVKPRVSICVPSTCSKDELQKIANKAVQTMDLPFGLQIPHCEVWNKEVEFERSEIAIMIILGVLLFLVITATAFDVYLKSKSEEDENGKNDLSLPTKYLLCFSLHANAKRLFMPDTEKDSIKIFHGMRVLTTIWVIAVHSMLYQKDVSNGRMLHFFTILPQVPIQILANGFINVQTFFFMSATLHAIRIMKMKEKINVKRHILRRIWRLAPTFMLVIACVILLPHVGSGPLWKETVKDLLADKCHERWWTHFLFINNFLRNDDMCLQWLWYIPVDFQLYVFSLLVLIPMKNNPTVGFTINFLIMIGAMVISAAFHIYYNLTPMLVLAFTHPEDVGYFLERGYFRPYLHCSSVCIGMAVGYFLVNRPPKIHISWKISAPLWLASVSACLSVLLGVHYWNQGHIPSIGISALYAGGSKILWSLTMAWLTIACMTGNGGIANKILSLPIFVPLGRLCYMVYLIHSLIHYMYIGSTRLPIRVELSRMLYTSFATIFVSFVCALPLTLLFESPFMALDKLIFSEKQSERTKRSKTLEKSEEEYLKNGDIVEDVNSDKKEA